MGLMVFKNEFTSKLKSNSTGNSQILNTFHLIATRYSHKKPPTQMCRRF